MFVHYRPYLQLPRTAVLSHSSPKTHINNLYKTSHGTENTPPPRHTILTVPNDTSGQLKRQMLLNCKSTCPVTASARNRLSPLKIYPVLFGSSPRLSGRYNNRQRPLPPQLLKLNQPLFFHSIRSYITFTN
jgi:hypothetical protein